MASRQPDPDLSLVIVEDFLERERGEGGKWKREVSL